MAINLTTSILLGSYNLLREYQKVPLLALENRLKTVLGQDPSGLCCETASWSLKSFSTAVAISSNLKSLVKLHNPLPSKQAERVVRNKSTHYLTLACSAPVCRFTWVIAGHMGTWHFCRLASSHCINLKFFCYP